MVDVAGVEDVVAFERHVKKAAYISD